MSLAKYNSKRDFKKTAEPKAGKSSNKDKLLFVIQKHDASRLHYDFRLEMGGVLKSWAVPKGPTTDPKLKRLAMMVEDHPFDYRTFEGTIPKGEYGAGTVIVWDQGTYETIADIKGKKAQEKYLLDELEKGSVKIKLHGEKLEGEFALVKTHGMGENAWLLIKHNDEFASKTDITKKDKSVLTAKDLKEMAAGAHVPVPVKAKKKSGTSRGKKVLPVDAAEEELDAKIDGHEPVEINLTRLLKSAPKAKMPTAIKPMKATLVEDPFDNDEWVFEVKWDGYRAIAAVNNEVELISRNKIPFDKYYPVVAAMKKWDFKAVLDGEILVLNDKGVADFGALQNWRSEADGNLVFYVFDILWYEGKSLVDLPLIQRRAILEKILPADDDSIRLSKVFYGKGIEFFDAATRIGLEGMIAKKASSTYTSDLRSREWLKVKVKKRQEVVIAGFTRNPGTNKSFSALILGIYREGKLVFAGKVGTGFPMQLQKELMEQFKPLITDEVPFDQEPDIDKPSRFRPQRLGAKPTWLKPELVAEVAFAEVTTDGVFRQASFKGMREDKIARDVVLEKAVPTDETVEEVEAIQPPVNKGRKTLLNPKDETQVRKVCGHDLKFTHLSKIYWPDDKITKRDMFNYYYQVAEYILPYLKDRPMSLNRFPGGITGKGFYQKDVTGKAPDWAKTFAHTTDDGKNNNYLVGNDEATLLWMATLGCIEMNPWFSRIQSPDNPDYCVIDLDPDKNTFDQVIQTALHIKEILDAIDVPSYCKTSGSTGMHIYIPLHGKYTYDQSQMFARIIVEKVHQELSEFTSIERKISARKGKMYLDFLQNRPGATIACPYSLRPKPGATVSMPLAWNEVKPGLKMSDFTIFNAVDRLKETGDLFKGALDEGIDLMKAVKKAKEVFSK